LRTLNVNACPSSSNQEDEEHIITLGPFGCIFQVLIVQKSAILLWLMWIFYQASPVAKSMVHHTIQQNKTHNNQHEPPPTYPSAALSSIAINRLPVSQLQAPGGGFALASACSFVWGANAYPIKNRAMGMALALGGRRFTIQHHNQPLIIGRAPWEVLEEHIAKPMAYFEVDE